jgi:ribosomal-protein-alanine N-acetyltransferase
MTEMGLSTARLFLAELQPAHADDLFSGLCDSSLYEFIDVEPPRDVASLRSRYERLAKRSSPDGREIWLNWSIQLRPELQFAGMVQATILEDQSAAIAYMLFQPFQGRGYAREAVTAMIDELRRAYSVTVFRASVDPRNVRSVALLASLGFQLEVCRKEGATIRGVVADEAEYVLI